jgi:anti-sigma B factor antagonist
MDLKTTQGDQQINYTVIGDIDETGAEKLGANFVNDRRRADKKVVIDFGQVGHIGSAGMGQLLLLYKDLAVKGKTVEIQNVSSKVFELLRVVKLDTLFQITRK